MVNDIMYCGLIEYPLMPPFYHSDAERGFVVEGVTPEGKEKGNVKIKKICHQKCSYVYTKLNN